MHYTKGRLVGLVGGARPRARRLAWAASAIALVAAVPAAEAQIGPTGGGGFGPSGGPRGAGQEDKKEGVAVAAPKAAGLLPTTPALPAPKSRRKRWKLLELDGYYRLRTDWFKNFHLGFNDAGAGGAPFPMPIGCHSRSAGAPCDNTLSSTNMRLRLEPTFNIDEGTSVHVQADALDNLVLGSTPAEQAFLYPTASTSAQPPPVGAYGNGNQSAPRQGQNGDRPSFEVKRAWAEVALPLGVLKFGRMPNHWGMGIFHNSGGADPINGGYDLDGDYGDTIDRASFSMLIPGTNLRGMIAMDWPLTRVVSNQTTDNVGREGHPINLDNNDDVSRYTAVVSRMDSPQEFRDTVERGELALNYGVYFEYTTQAWDFDINGFTGATTVPDDPTKTITNNATPGGGQRFTARNLKLYSPDVWAKVGYGPLQIEAELVGQIRQHRRHQIRQLHAEIHRGAGIAQDLVTRHGGLIEFDSAPGRTVFTISLPLEAS